MKFSLALASVLLLCVSCTRGISSQAVNPNRPSAVHNALQRQVDNAVDAGEGDAILRLLRRRMAADPRDLSVRIELAEHYRKVGHSDLALEHYRLAAERFPDEPRIVLAMAQLLDAQGSPREAIQIVEQFLASHQSPSPDLHAWLGYLRDQSGGHAEAEASHRAAVAANPSSAKLHNNLGYNLLLQSKREEAISEFQRALEIDPKMEMARNNLGTALIKETGPNGKREALDQWLKTGGDRVAAHNNAAAALIEQGRYAEARQELDAALRLNRQHVPALKNLELLATLDGQPAALPTAAGSQAGQASRSVTGGAGENPSGQPSTVVRSLKRFWSAIAGIETQPAARVARGEE